MKKTKRKNNLGIFIMLTNKYLECQSSIVKKSIRSQSNMNEKLLEKCYAGLSLCLSMIHNVFLIYHVEVYVYSFNIDQR